MSDDQTIFLVVLYVPLRTGCFPLMAFANRAAAEQFKAEQERAAHDNAAYPVTYVVIAMAVQRDEAV